MTIKATPDGDAAITAVKKKHTAAFHNALINIKNNKKTMILIAALHLFAVPLYMIMTAVSITNGRGGFDDNAYFVIGGVATVIAGLSGIIIAVNCFGYLHKKTEADMRLSLPLSKRQRFVSDFFSGMFSYIAPFIAVQVISCLLLGIFHLTMDGRVFPDYINTHPDSTEPFNFICKEFRSVAPYYFKLLVLGVIVMAMFYTLTVLVITCCGAAFESVFYTLLVNAMIPLVIYAVAECVMGGLYGINPMGTLFSVLFTASPVGGALGALASLGGSVLWRGVLALCAELLIVTAIYFAGARALYMKRRAEQASKPFVYKGIYYFAVSAVTFCIGAVGFQEYRENGDNFDHLVPSIIITAFIYLILEAVSNRGFKKFWKGAARYAVTFGALFALSYVVSATDGFGAVWSVPSAEDVSGIAIAYNGPFGIIDVSQKDSIEAVIDLHSQILSDHKAGLDSSFYSGIDIIYKLKDGREKMRRYNALTAESHEKLAYFETSGGYKSAAAEKLKTSMLNAYERRSALADYHISVDPKYQFISGRGYNSYQIPQLRSRAFYEELSDALIKDITAETPELWLAGSRDAFTLNILYNEGGVIAVKDHYENVREVLKKYGIGRPEIGDGDGDIRSIENTLYDSGLQILSYDDYINHSGNLKIFPRIGAYKVFDGNAEWHYIFDYSDDVLTLLKAAKTNCFTDEKRYVLICDGGYVAVIPEEYNRIAERVYAASRDERDAPAAE